MRGEALRGLIGQLAAIVELADEAAARPDPAYFVVACPMTGKATCRRFDALADAAGHLRGLRAADLEIQVFVFVGDRYLLSRGGDYLLAPHDHIPLFAAAAPEDADDDGYLGTAPDLGVADDGDDEGNSAVDDDEQVDEDD